MLKPLELYDFFLKNNISFYTGVPDSLLKDFCAYVTDNVSEDNHIITANEGNAIGLASGYHLATGKIPVVYMQNSGLGNCINPLTSLSDKEVYSIPKLLLIGWRGEPGKKDEPQHIKKGEITLGLLNTLGIKYSILPDSSDESEKVVNKAVDYVTKNSSPYAIVVRDGTFEKYQLNNINQTKKVEQAKFSMSREDSMKLLISLLKDDGVVVSTTGKISRELFELRSLNEFDHSRDFLTVGSMGHASSIALGIAMQKVNSTVYCFDGDGALIMHMGALATIGKVKPKNLVHFVFNNFSHDSVGGQPTSADVINIPKIAISNGYNAAFSVISGEEIRFIMDKIKFMQGPILIEIRCNKGARNELGRPTSSPIENKINFMKYLEKR